MELELDDRCCRWARDLADLLNLRDQVRTSPKKQKNTKCEFLPPYIGYDRGGPGQPRQGEGIQVGKRMSYTLKTILTFRFLFLRRKRVPSAPPPGIFYDQASKFEVQYSFVGKCRSYFFPDRLCFQRRLLRIRGPGKIGIFLKKIINFYISRPLFSPSPPARGRWPRRRRSGGRSANFDFPNKINFEL